MPSPSQEALAWEKVLNFFKEHLTDGAPPQSRHDSIFNWRAGARHGTPQV